MPNRLVRHAFIALACALVAAPAAAQDAPKNIISLNPFGIVFSILNAEYERALTPNVSAGISGTWWDFDDDVDGFDDGDVENSFTYTSADLKLRYYPGAVLRGFSAGVLVGVTEARGSSFDCNGTICVEDEDTETVPSAGIEIDYAWRLGAREKFYIGLGIGAKRLFIDDDDIDFTTAYPFGRFNIGWAF